MFRVSLYVQSEKRANMPVASEVKLIIPAFAAPDRLKEQWSEVLQLDAVRINEKAQAVIDGEASFSSKLAGPSSAGYNPMIKSTFVSRSGHSASQIKRNQQVNLARSYDKWSDKMNYQYATVDAVPAKRFKDVVDASKDSMAAGLSDATLPLTGTKIEGRGLVALAAFWLVGDARVDGWLRPGDVLIKGPAFEITAAIKRFAFKSMLVGRLIYCGAELIKANFDETLRLSLNQTTAELIQGFTDAGKDIVPFVGEGPDSMCAFKVDPTYGRVLHIKVSTL